MITLLGVAPCLALPPDGHETPMPFVYRNWQTFTTRSGLPHDSILALHVRGDQVWVGTEAGLAVGNAAGWKTWTTREGLPWPVITAIDIDNRTEEVWLGTWGGGLMRFSGGRFRQLNQLNSGLAGDLVFALAVTEHQVVAATNGGLSVFHTNDDAWDLLFERRRDAVDVAITDLSLASSGLYAAAWCDGLRRIDLPQGNWSMVDFELGARRTVSLAALGGTSGVSRAGRSLWCATQGLLLRREDGDRWDMQAVPQRGGDRTFVTCLSARDEAEAWVGTDRGLRVLADWSTETWVRYTTGRDATAGQAIVERGGSVASVVSLESAPASDRVRCIRFQNDDVWVGTASGLMRATGSGRWAGMRVVEAASARTEPTTGEPVMQPSPSGRSLIEDPGHLEAVNIAVLRPEDRTISFSGMAPARPDRPHQRDRLAVSLAIEQANARGGYRGYLPFALVTGPEGVFTGWGWTMPEDDFASAAHGDRAWGLVGFLESDSRITTAVATRTELPLVNFASTSATIDESLSPWIFRCMGDMPRRHRCLLDYVFNHLGHTRLAVLRTGSGSAQAPLEWWSRHARDRGHPLVADVEFDPRSDDCAAGLGALQSSAAEVVLTWCPAPLSAAILRRIREAGLTQLFVGSDQIICEEFIDLVGREPGQVIAVCPPTGGESLPAQARFARAFTARFGHHPPDGAYRAYEATNHLLAAVSIAGLDREAIRQTLVAMTSDPKGERHCEDGDYNDPEGCVARLVEGEWAPCLQDSH